MNNVKDFVKQWSGRGYEKGEMQPFWLSFLRDVLGISEPEKFIRFEVPAKLKHTSFIDAFSMRNWLVFSASTKFSATTLLKKKIFGGL